MGWALLIVCAGVMPDRPVAEADQMSSGVTPQRPAAKVQRIPFIDWLGYLPLTMKRPARGFKKSAIPLPNPILSPTSTTLISL